MERTLICQIALAQHPSQRQPGTVIFQSIPFWIWHDLMNSIIHHHLGYEKIVELLLQNNAHVDLNERIAKSALDKARANGNSVKYINNFVRTKTIRFFFVSIRKYWNCSRSSQSSRRTSEKQRVLYRIIKIRCFGMSCYRLHSISVLIELVLLGSVVN